MPIPGSDRGSVTRYEELLLNDPLLKIVLYTLCENDRKVPEFHQNRGFKALNFRTRLGSLDNLKNELFI